MSVDAEAFIHRRKRQVSELPFVPSDYHGADNFDGDVGFERGFADRPALLNRLRVGLPA